jgi:hypothetical protein
VPAEVRAELRRPAAEERGKKGKQKHWEM